MRRILVLNSKGGCGKSTIATCLAGYYASRGYATALLDYDPQGSSMQWLKLRGKDYQPIHGIAAFEQNMGFTRTWHMRLPNSIDKVVMDAPAGVSGLQLVDFVRTVDDIIMPVLPSPIDIHAAAHFIQDLLLIGKAKKHGTRIAVIANRVRENTRIFKDLQKFLSSLQMPFLSVIRDSQDFIIACGMGVSVLEFNPHRAYTHLPQWFPVIQWLDSEDAVSFSATLQQPINAN